MPRRVAAIGRAFTLAIQATLNFLWSLFLVLLARVRGREKGRSDDGLVVANIRRDEGLRRARMIQQLNLYSAG
eukprot:m.73609 g.73609  ORF g.73609 m.73609 type:complete len:73 (-) comp13041_c0_seq3:1742-1960(-)